MTWARYLRSDCYNELTARLMKLIVLGHDLAHHFLIVPCIAIF